MGDNNRKLEEFFRKQYNRTDKYEIPDEWNTPPDQIWSNIKENLSEKKDDKYPFIYSLKGIVLITVGVLIILFLGHHYSIEKVKNENLQKELKSTKQIIADLLNATDNESIKQPKVEELEKSKNNDDKYFSSQNSVTPVTKNALTQLSDSNFTSNTDYNNNLRGNISFDDGSLINSNASLDESAFNTIQDKSDHNSSLKINYGDGLPNEASELEMNELVMLNRSTIQNLPINFALNDPVSSPIEIVKPNPSFYAGLEMGKAFKINERPTDFRGIGFPQNSIVFENQFSSRNIGFKIGYQISPHFAIESGLQYINSSVNIDHNRMIAISTLREIQDANGNFIGGFNFDIPTSTGSIGTDVVSSRRSSSILDPDENINIRIDIDHNIDQLSLPLIARYSRTFGPFTAAVRTGIVNTWNLNNGLVVNDIQSSNEDFIFQSKTDPTGNGQNRVPQNRILNYLVGLAMEYQVSDDWKLYIEPSYTQSTSPLANIGRFQAFNKMIFFTNWMALYTAQLSQVSSYLNALAKLPPREMPNAKDTTVKNSQFVFPPNRYAPRCTRAKPKISPRVTIM